MMNSIELFSGTGGLAYGLSQSGFSHLALYEWNKYACENLRRNFPSLNVICSDVRNADFSVFEGVDLVAGDPPCQPFYYHGKSELYRKYPADRPIYVGKAVPSGARKGNAGTAVSQGKVLYNRLDLATMPPAREDTASNAPFGTHCILADPGQSDYSKTNGRQKKQYW